MGSMGNTARVEVVRDGRLWSCSIPSKEWICGACVTFPVDAKLGEKCDCGAEVVRIVRMDGQVEVADFASPEAPAAKESSESPPSSSDGEWFTLPDGQRVRVISDPQAENWPALIARATGLPEPEDPVLCKYQQSLLTSAFAGGKRNGTVSCACCGRDVREWKRRLHLTMRKQIWALSKAVAVGEPFKLEELLGRMRKEWPDLKLPSRSDETKLPYFGLLMRVRKDAEDVRGDNPYEGRYVLTQEGLDFAQSRATAPRYAYFYDATLLGVSAERTYLQDDGDRFDWSGLMQGTGG